MLTLLKPLLDVVLCGIAHARWARPTDRWLRPLGMALARVLLGLVVGTAVAVAVGVLDLEVAGFLGFAIMTPVRVALWYALLVAFYPATSRNQRIAFVVAATALSTAIDAVDTEGESMLQAATHFRMC